MSEYICSVCKETFEKIHDETWSEEKAKKEYHELFPNSKWEDRTEVCDDCWKKIRPTSPWYESR